MGSKLPEIPHNKKYHLFVCYEKNSLDVVRKIVDNLEENGLLCCYYDRDFVAGRSILDNIYDGLKKSLSMLIVLSEEFESSVYCKHEMDEAFNLMLREEYNLIPIKTEPCNVPERLKHLVYIDVEDDVDRAHDKIIDAVLKKDLQNDSKQDRNGKSLQFDMKQDRHGVFTFTKYELKFTDTDKAKIWKKKFQVSAELLQEVEETVNDSLLVKYCHIWTFDGRILLLFFLHLLVVIFIIFLILLITTSGREKADSFQPAGYVLAIGLPLWLISLITIECVCHEKNWKGMYRVKLRARNMLMSKLWCLSRRNHARTGVIFFLSRTLLHPDILQLNIMHYNLTKCEAFFASRLERVEALKKIRKENETNAECTSRIFDDVMSRFPGELLLPSTATRHKMKNGAKCLCLLAEEFQKGKLSINPTAV